MLNLCVRKKKSFASTCKYCKNICLHVWHVFFMKKFIIQCFCNFLVCIHANLTMISKIKQTTNKIHYLYHYLLRIPCYMLSYEECTLHLLISRAILDHTGKTKTWSHFSQKISFSHAIINISHAHGVSLEFAQQLLAYPQTRLYGQFNTGSANRENRRRKKTEGKIQLFIKKQFKVEYRRSWDPPRPPRSLSAFGIDFCQQTRQCLRFNSIKCGKFLQCRSVSRAGFLTELHVARCVHCIVNYFIFAGKTEKKSYRNGCQCEDCARAVN